MLMTSSCPTMEGLAQPCEGSSECTSMNRPASMIAVTMLPVRGAPALPVGVLDVAAAGSGLLLVHLAGLAQGHHVLAAVVLVGHRPGLSGSRRAVAVACHGGRLRALVTGLPAVATVPSTRPVLASARRFSLGLNQGCEGSDPAGDPGRGPRGSGHGRRGARQNRPKGPPGFRLKRTAVEGKCPLTCGNFLMRLVRNLTA